MTREPNGDRSDGAEGTLGCPRTLAEEEGEPLRTALIVIAVVSVAGFVSPARASQLLDRNATDVSLEVDAHGRALVTYRTAGTLRHVLAWGAIDARAPSSGRSQVRFRLDYSGGEASLHRAYWRTFRNRCRSYDGPSLAWLVTACRAPDGTYWALQSWQRDLPDYGVTPTAAQAAWELHLSHWSGALPALYVHTDWAWRRWAQVYGRLEYAGSPVYGFASSSTGAPLDRFGRNVYLDVFDSAYGSGWWRENSFLTHERTGAFCYSANPHGSRPAARGAKYRATVEGPGVTPDVMWEGRAPGGYDPAADARANQAIAALRDRLCRPN